jgi:hypothetical protein
MRRVLIVLLVLFALGAAAPVRAATVEDIVALTRAGVAEPVILALIERDKSIFTIDAAQLAALQADGVTEPVILAMLKSGRGEAEQAIRAENEMRLANLAATSAPGPQIVVVGHGPDRPNAAPDEEAAAPESMVPVPYFAPVGVPVESHRGRHGRHGMVAPPILSSLCVTQVPSTSSVTGRGVGFLTPCPSTLQPPAVRVR